MVAAAGETAGLSPRVGLICFAGVVLGVILIAVIGAKENGLNLFHKEESPLVLAGKAREIIRNLGYTAPPNDKASGLIYDEDFLSYVEKNDGPRPPWDRILLQRPPVLRFWYRQSPRPMIPQNLDGEALTPGIVQPGDPPMAISEMAAVRLDLDGRLLLFQAIPPELEETPQSTAGTPQASSQQSQESLAGNWNLLLTAAGIDPSQLHSASPIWNPLVNSDSRAAWTGTWPGTDRPLRIEAAALHGKPVFFSLIGEWTRPTRMRQTEQTASENVGTMIVLFTFLIMASSAIFFAYRNYKRGRGDRQGALRLAGMVFAVAMVLFLLRVHYVATLVMIFLLCLETSTALFISGIMWVLYMALEPYVRRHWPQTIISWSRLMGGRLRDPLVGRDVLSGVAMGLGWVLAFNVGYFFLMRAGARPALPSTEFLLGIPDAFGYWLGRFVVSILGTLIFFIILVVLRVLVRIPWLAGVLFIALFLAPKLLSSSHPMIEAPIWLIIYVIAAVAVVRFGLVVLATATFTANTLLNVPSTLDFSNWYALNSVLVLLGFVAIAAWGFYTSMAGQRLLKDDLFE